MMSHHEARVMDMSLEVGDGDDALPVAFFDVIFYACRIKLFLGV